jgi:transmembrane sensor
MELEKLIAYITGNLDEPSCVIVREWIESSDENRKEFYRLKNIYALSSSESRIPEIHSDYLKLKGKLKLPFKERLVIGLKQTLKYAAVVAITLLSAYLFNLLDREEDAPLVVQSFHTVSAPLGQISEFAFADGTRVWLNSGTTLSIPDSDPKEIRQVKLEGEAFFEVTENKDKPFVVQTGNQEIRVFGTSFNVRSYEGTGFIETTLVEGSLGVSIQNSNEIQMLRPGEQFRNSLAGGKNILQKVDTHHYEAWKEGKLIFRNKPLGEIASDLERWYNVRIKFEQEEIKDYRFSGTILKYKPIDQILEAIKLTSPIRFTINVHPERSSEIVLYARK